VNDHVRRDRRRQSEIVGGGKTVDKHPELVASGEGINDLAIVGDRRSSRQAVDPGRVVQTSVNASQLAGLHQTLKRLIDGVSIAKIEEVYRCPDLSCWSSRDPICDSTFEVGHRPIFAHKFRTATRRRRRLNGSIMEASALATRSAAAAKRALSALANVPGGYTGAVRRTRFGRTAATRAYSRK
jgi:hypothetical protein